MSKKEIHDALSEELLQFLDGQRLVLLSTVDAETGSPAVSAISWVKALDAHTIRFSVAISSKIVPNLRNHPGATMCLIGLGTVYSISGSCRIVEEPMQGVQMRLAKLELSVESVQESMFWGSKIVTEPAYEKTQMIEKSVELDRQVFSILLES